MPVERLPMYGACSPLRVNDSTFQKTIALNDVYLASAHWPYPMGSMATFGKLLGSILTAHDLDNLYIADSSVFPASGANNTSPTIAALSPRRAERQVAARRGSR